MIYVSNKLKYLFDFIPTAVNEEGIKASKFIYSLHHENEVKNIPYDKWDVVVKNGDHRDLRSQNLELVIFKED